MQLGTVWIAALAVMALVAVAAVRYASAQSERARSSEAAARSWEEKCAILQQQKSASANEIMDAYTEIMQLHQRIENLEQKYAERVAQMAGGNLTKMKMRIWLN